jgi:hypothetical protein
VKRREFISLLGGAADCLAAHGARASQRSFEHALADFAVAALAFEQD